jgi:hypothetical protein
MSNTTSPRFDNRLDGANESLRSHPIIEHRDVNHRRRPARATHRLSSSLAYEDPHPVKSRDRGYELDPRLCTSDFLRKALYGCSKRDGLLEGLEDRENIRASRNTPVSNTNVRRWPEL